MRTGDIVEFLIMLSPIISNWVFTSIVGLELGMSYNVTHNLILPSAVVSVIVSSRI
jgi:hypothetical protein